MSRTRNRYQHKKIAKSAQDLIAFFSQALYQRSPKLRRAMRLEDLEAEIAFTSDYFISWLENRDRQLRSKPALASRSNAMTSLPGTGSKTSEDPEQRAFFWEQMRLMADLGTGVWRMRRELESPGSTKDQEIFRLPYRYLLAAWDRLSEAGISIRDYSGLPAESDQSFFLLPQETDPENQDLPEFETIKPAIYYQENQRARQIQVGYAINRR